MNELYYVVFDFETSGLSIEAGAEAIQVAGKVYDPRTLSPIPKEEGGEFCSLMRVLHPERLDTEGAKKALAVNKKTKEEILAAPDQKLVWNQFVDWVMKWNRKKNKWGAPIGCGKNIRHFDMKFVEMLNELHCKKGKATVLFSERRQVDLEDYIFAWFENSDELENEKMDTLRDYFGLSHEGGHDAGVDVAQTGELIMRFLKLKRELRKRKNKEGGPLINFKGGNK